MQLYTISFYYYIRFRYTLSIAHSVFYISITNWSVRWRTGRSLAYRDLISLFIVLLLSSRAWNKIHFKVTIIAMCRALFFSNKKKRERESVHSNLGEKRKKKLNAVSRPSENLPIRLRFWFHNDDERENPVKSLNQQQHAFIISKNRQGWRNQLCARDSLRSALAKIYTQPKTTKEKRHSSCLLLYIQNIHSNNCFFDLFFHVGDANAVLRPFLLFPLDVSLVFVLLSFVPTLWIAQNNIREGQTRREWC
jgi:hypothetical protein